MGMSAERGTCNCVSSVELGAHGSSVQSLPQAAECHGTQVTVGYWQRRVYCSAGSESCREALEPPNGAFEQPKKLDQCLHVADAFLHSLGRLPPLRASMPECQTRRFQFYGPSHERETALIPLGPPASSSQLWHPVRGCGTQFAH